MESENKKSWHCLHLAIPQNWAEEMGARCFELGSCGLETLDEGEDVHLIVYFDEGVKIEEIRQGVEEFARSLGRAVEVEIGRVEEEDWEAEWRRFFRPVWATDRIVVHPSWIPLQVEPEQVAIVIDPKMAFGTGGHESTRLCLRALEKHLRVGDRCLDLGTGSGLLAIAAVRLEARCVLAVDIDPLAVENARENACCNGIEEGKLEVRIGSIEQAKEECYELILANIQSHILRPLIEPVRQRLVPGGWVIFSGLLVREEETFGGWVEAGGLEIDSIHGEGNWICIVARRPA
jgi:ribosomal protein L11 methyltransferase